MPALAVSTREHLLELIGCADDDTLNCCVVNIPVVAVVDGKVSPAALQGPFRLELIVHEACYLVVKGCTTLPSIAEYVDRRFRAKRHAESPAHDKIYPGRSVVKAPAENCR